LIAFLLPPREAARVRALGFSAVTDPLALTHIDASVVVCIGGQAATQAEQYCQCLKLVAPGALAAAQTRHALLALAMEPLVHGAEGKNRE
jgi:hypothetical protein